MGMLGHGGDLPGFIGALPQSFKHLTTHVTVSGTRSLVGTVVEFHHATRLYPPQLSYMMSWLSY